MGCKVRAMRRAIGLHGLGFEIQPGRPKKRECRFARASGGAMAWLKCSCVVGHFSSVPGVPERLPIKSIMHDAPIQAIDADSLSLMRTIFRFKFDIPYFRNSKNKMDSIQLKSSTHPFVGTCIPHNTIHSICDPLRKQPGNATFPFGPSTPPKSHFSITTRPSLVLKYYSFH